MNVDSKSIDNSNNYLDTKVIALTATFTALVFIATTVFYFNIVATSGFFNLGESMVYLSALIGGPVVGFFAGAFGSSLADIALGYGQFAPGTFIIKGFEGFATGYLFKKLKNLDQHKIKYIYIAFTSIFISISIIVTTPSLYDTITKFDISIFLSSLLSDVGSDSFAFNIDLYYPEGTDLFKVHNFGISFSGIFFIIFVILLCALLWVSYFKLGERSKMIMSCAVGGLIMVIGYFLYEVIGLGFVPTVAFLELPFNISQVLVGMAIAIPTVSYLINLGVIEENI